jgi:hypothetical protein
LNINLDPPVVIEDRQLAVLAAHVATTMRRLTNVQRSARADNNQPKIGSKDFQNITLNVKF